MAELWTEDRALALVRAFEAHGACFSKVAEVMGVHHRTAKRAWEHGLRASKARGFAGLRPVREIVQEAQVAARAALVEEIPPEERQPQPELTPAPPPIAVEINYRDQLDAMRQDVLEARIRTGRVIRVAKANLQRALPGLTELVAATSDLAASTASAMRRVEVTQLKPQDGNIKISTSMFLIKDVAQLQRDFLESLRIITDLERRELGEPTEITAVAVAMTEKESFEMLKNAKDVFEHIDVEALESPGQTFEN